MTNKDLQDRIEYFASLYVGAGRYTYTMPNEQLMSYIAELYGTILYLQRRVDELEKKEKRKE
jgi:hypothetical protein